MNSIFTQTANASSEVPAAAIVLLRHLNNEIEHGQSNLMRPEAINSTKGNIGLVILSEVYIPRFIWICWSRYVLSV